MRAPDTIGRCPCGLNAALWDGLCIAEVGRKRRGDAMLTSVEVPEQIAAGMGPDAGAARLVLRGMG